jgi:hypothetical protein
MTWRGPTAVTVRAVRADERSAAGWESRHYGTVLPAWSLILELQAEADGEMVFEFLRR